MQHVCFFISKANQKANMCIRNKPTKAGFAVWYTMVYLDLPSVNPKVVKVLHCWKIQVYLASCATCNRRRTES